MLLIGGIAAPQAARAEHADNKVRVLLLGDSTTAGTIPRAIRPTGPHLEQSLEMLLAAEEDPIDAVVINSGKGSEHVRGLIDSGRYDREIAELPDIDYVFLRYGLNDRVLCDDFAEEFPRDLRELINKLRSDHPQAKIILTTVIPFSAADVTTEINELVKKVAAREQLPLFDLHASYAAALEAQGPHSLNYRRYAVDRVPAKYRNLIRPYRHDGSVVVLDNELDALFVELPGWLQSDRHPNFAGYNVIAVATAEYLADEMRHSKRRQ